MLLDRFTKEGFSVLGGRWALSSSNIVALNVAIVTARENNDILLPRDIQVNLFGERVSLNSLWGAEDLFRDQILKRWKSSL